MHTISRNALLLSTSLLCLLSAAPDASAAASAGDCASLIAVAFPSVTISAASVVSSITLKNAAGPAAVNKPFCRVQAVARPTSDSEILFEIWLPPTREAWNARMKTEATGGYLGGIPYGRMGQMLEAGFAAVGTNLGHEGGEAETWAMGHPEKVNDYAYRAHYYVGNTAKAVISAYYGQGPKQAYFDGCSGGGRQGQMMAQRYPDLYDGIIVGAPTMFYSDDILNIIAQAIKHRTSATAEMTLPPAKLPMITADVMKVCDAKDGAKDGEITDPRNCSYDAKRLLCKGGDAGDCLTHQQVDLVNASYGGTASKGAPVTPGPAVGSEFLWQQGANLATTGGYGNFIGHYVFGQKDFDWRKINFDTEYDMIKQKLDPILAAPSPDLSRFKARGGKIIQYHGWNDPVNMPWESPNFYAAIALFEKYRATPEKLDEAMSKLTPADVAALVLSTKDVDSYYRVFMAPGMAHCTGGSGTTNFNQQTNARSPGAGPVQDIVAALVHWVEDGVAPEQIIATEFKDGANAKDVVRQRPLCAYPKVAKYKGTGDINAAASFSCVMPAKATVTPRPADMAQIRNAMTWRKQLTPVGP